MNRDRDFYEPYGDGEIQFELIIDRNIAVEISFMDEGFIAHILVFANFKHGTGMFNLSILKDDKLPQIECL